MAKKELTYLDILKKEYSELVKINQKLKYISKGYYISYDGKIYLQSLVPFAESVITLRYPDKLNFFRGGTVLPNSFFDFSKNAKKTKLTFKETENDKGKCFVFGQEDCDLSYTYQITNPEPSLDNEYIDEIINPNMYKMFFTDFSNAYKYNDTEFMTFTEDQIQALLDAKPLFFEYNDNEFVLTKHMFLDIKKGDKIGIIRVAFITIENGKRKVFYFLKHETDLYEKITLINTIQS